MGKNSHNMSNKKSTVKIPQGHEDLVAKIRADYPHFSLSRVLQALTTAGAETLQNAGEEAIKDALLKA